MESHAERHGRSEYRFPSGMDFWDRYRDGLLSRIEMKDLLDYVRNGAPGMCRLHAGDCLYDIRPLSTGGMEVIRRDGDGNVDMAALIMAQGDGSLNVYTSVEDAPGAEEWSRSAVKRMLGDIYVLNRAYVELRPMIEDRGEAS